MKVIQTFYKGFHFRSRLEARYAVMFDAAGLEWVYEPEGYELPSGRYLPDFYIPKWDAFVEIKGKEPCHAEFQKCFELSVAADKTVILFEGQPETEEDRGDRLFSTVSYAFNASVESTLFSTSFFTYDEGESIFSKEAFPLNEKFIENSLFLYGIDLDSISDRRRVMRAHAAQKNTEIAFYRSIGDTFNLDYRYGLAERVSGAWQFNIFVDGPVRAARSARFEFGGR